MPSQGRPEARESRWPRIWPRPRRMRRAASLLPQVSFHGAFEADRQQFVNPRRSQLAGIGVLRWNLFNGMADKARIEEAGHLAGTGKRREQRADSAVRLEVRRAWAGLRAAQQRIEVARASVAEAEESLRITQNRYEAGMSNVTDLLRNETARAGKPDAISGRGSRSARGRHHAGPGRGTADRGFGGIELMKP